MTVQQVANAAAEAIKFSVYLGVRNSSGRLFGYNPHLSNVSFLAKKAEENAGSESWIKSFIYISFQEYIRIKKPII